MKDKIKQIIICIILFIIVILIDKLTNLNNIIMFFLYLIPYIFISYDIYKESLEEIHDRNIFSENTLMVVATVTAFFIGFMPNTSPMYTEAVFVMLFYQIGELFEIIATNKSVHSMNALMNIRPDYANILVKGKTKRVLPSTIRVGDTIIVKPGEKIPLDGVIISGNSLVSTLAITGESVPREVRKDDIVYSGFINKNSILTIRVTKTFTESTASKIIDLVKNSAAKKSKKEKFITKFSKIYTPIVIILAILITVIPSIITKDISTWLTRGLTFLVVSCPCALVISVPLSFFGGVGASSKKGVLFKGTNYLEIISNINTIVFDKTGTLTEGVFEVESVHPKNITQEELLHLAVHIESNSNHPIAASIVTKDKDKSIVNDNCNISHVMEIEGHGLKATINGKTYYLGNDKLMQKIKTHYHKTTSKTTVHLASEDTYYGYIVISDRVKPDAKATIDYFKNNHVNTIMLTGDKENIARGIQHELGIDKYYSELLPDEKVEIINSLEKNNNVVAFVGDGINDTPSLARADIGISLGGIGQDAALDAADVILMNDNLLSLIDAIKISKKSNRIAKENIIFSITIKILVLLLSSIGLTSMWMAIFADVGVTILATLNSMRTLS